MESAMAKPRKAAGRKGVGGRPRSPEPKKSIASFKGTAKFEKWFEGLVAHTRLPASILLEHALIEYALNHGYKEPAPER